MDSTERLVQTWMSSGRDEEVGKLAEEISSGRSSLLSVVKALGEYLTSEEDVVRGKGVEFLSIIIPRCPAEFINRPAVHTLCSFFEDKLEDPATTISALKGLDTLVTFSAYSGADAVKTVKALFAYVDTKALNPPSRHIVYKILDVFIANHRAAMQSMGDEFLSGFRNLLDGEKDPRNLMLIFQMDRVVCIEFDISKHVEELFDIIFCYFPISFRPPKDDPYGITPDELKLALRSCMSSSPFFGELAIKLFLDKLLAGSPTTKKDTLETLECCLPIYGAYTTRKHAKQLWNTMKLEIFQPVNQEIEKEALRTTEVLIKAIYDRDMASEGSSQISMDFVEEMCEECLALVDEPEKSQAIPASKVIAALIVTTPKISDYVTSQSIPRLMKLYRDPGEAIHRPQILTLLCIVLGAYDDTSCQSTLGGYKDDILGSLISGLQHSPSSREASLEGLKKLSKLRGFLSEEELLYVTNGVNELLQIQGSSDDGSDSSDDALDVLCTIAEEHSKIIEEQTLPILFSALPDKPPRRDVQGEWESGWRVLRHLGRLCIPAPLFETLCIRLMTKLDIVCAPKSTDSPTADDLEARAAYAYSFLKALASVVELKINAKHPDVAKYIDRLVPLLFNLFIFLSLSASDGESLASQTKLYVAAGQVITLVVRTASPERHRKLASDLHSLYFEGVFSPLADGHHTLPEEPFNPLSNHASPGQQNSVILLSAAVIAFHKEVWLSSQDPSEFLVRMQEWSLREASNDTQKEAANHLIASQLNKNAKELSVFIDRQLNTVWPEMKRQSIAMKKSIVKNWLWIVRALVALNHSSANVFINDLFELLNDEDIAVDAARSIGEVTSDDAVLIKQNNAQLRLLYQQKYFQSILPRITESLKDCRDQQRQKVYLTALTSLLASLPSSIYKSEMPNLIVYLIQGLELPDNSIRQRIINILTNIYGQNGEVSAQEYAGTLTLGMLAIASSEDASPVELRSAALRFLSKLPKIVRYDVLHPQKNNVLRSLGKVLDDRRRVVRREAVNARTAWYSYHG